MPCALGVDVGTTNLKVALVRDDATVLGAAQRAVPIERGPDTATQDASRTKRIKAGTRRLGNRPAGGGTE